MDANRRDGPLIVQKDWTVLLELSNPKCEAAREEVAQFAELVSAPPHVHTYRMTKATLWSAADRGLSAQSILESLERFAKYPLGERLKRDIAQTCGSYGVLRLVRREGRLALESADPALLEKLMEYECVRTLLGGRRDASSCWVEEANRGAIKIACVQLGYPVKDLAGYVEGGVLPVRLLERTRSGKPFALRRYQLQAVESFWGGGTEHGGSGIVVLPCGAGKTIVGIAVMARASTNTLILTASTTAVRQWLWEIEDKTDLPSLLTGEYTGDIKQVKPVTVTTYQMLTHRRGAGYSHLELFRSGNWGLVIYDEVHLLPAPVFRFTAHIQAVRRLGLTATLLREDGREADVFTLIGPKKLEVGWKSLEKAGWIAQAECHEIRIGMEPEYRERYSAAGERLRFRLAAENPEKLKVLERLLARHKGDRVLVIGQFVSQLRKVASRLGIPLVTGRTSSDERTRLYQSLRNGDISCLVVSKVANFSVDLPEARVAIQLSGSFGSRQEEAQRLGRILRPKADGGPAYFYTLISVNTKEEEFARKRQSFLVEQGYRYIIHESWRDSSNVAGS
ncbi:MAG TPA: DEAD/DEAH box helicase family protein [Firmicutes bacterium]|nr:DEAD/DEAH box helicase family protein [Bacillota bacterium]